MASYKQWCLVALVVLVSVDVVLSATGTGTSTITSGGGNGGAGYSSKKGKNGMLNLKVDKRRDVYVTDMDRMLFQDMRHMDDDQAELMVNTTLSYSYVSELLRITLGDLWYEQVELPSEDLTALEVLRLTASINEYTMNYHPGRGGGKARASPFPGSCICHGTASNSFSGGYVVTRELGESDAAYESRAHNFFKSQPFKGVRLFDVGLGHFKPTTGGHNSEPYANRDCFLCLDGCEDCCTGLCTADGAQSNFDYDPDSDGVDTSRFICDRENEYNVVACSPPPPVDETCVAAIQAGCESCDEAMAAVSFVFSEESESDSSNLCTCFGAVNAFCTECDEALTAVDSATDCNCRDYIEHMYDAGIGEEVGATFTLG